MDQFWKRNIYLSGIQGVIISFYMQSFSELYTTYKLFLLIIAVLGILLSICCFFLINTNRLWFEYYENKIKDFENEMLGDINIDCNRSIVEKSSIFKVFGDCERDKLQKRWIYTSTKKMCLGICCVFAIFWMLIINYLIVIIMIEYNLFLPILKLSPLTILFCMEIFIIYCYIMHILILRMRYNIYNDKERRMIAKEKDLEIMQ